MPERSKSGKPSKGKDERPKSSSSNKKTSQSGGKIERDENRSKNPQSSSACSDINHKERLQSRLEHTKPPQTLTPRNSELIKQKPVPKEKVREAREARASIRDQKPTVAESDLYIMVEYAVPGFAEFLGAFDIPAGGGHGLPHGKEPSVAILLTWDKPPSLLYARGHISHGLEIPRTDRGKVLITESEFHQLSKLLKLMCSFATPGAVYILSEPEDGLVTQDIPRKPRHELAINVTLAEKLNTELRTEFVKSLRTVLGGGYRMRLQGIPDHHVDMILDRTAPRLIWMRAVLLDRMTAALAMKRDADKILVGGDPDGAYTRYLMILRCFSYQGRVAPRRYLERTSWHLASHTRIVLLRQQWACLKLDLCFSVMMLDILRTVAEPEASPTEALFWGNDIARNEERLIWSLSQYYSIEHMKFLAILAGRRHQRLSEALHARVRMTFIQLVNSSASDSGRKADAMLWLKSREKLREVQCTSELCRYQPLTKTQSQDSTNDPLVIDVLKQMSFLKDGFRPFTSIEKVEIENTCVGWQHQEHLEQLTEANKKIINSDQRLNRFPLSFHDVANPSDANRSVNTTEPDSD